MEKVNGVQRQPQLGTTTPWLVPAPLCYQGPFRTNVQGFLRSYGEKVSLPGLNKIRIWVLRLKGEASVRPVNLHVYEERLAEGSAPICDQCRNMGWQHHPVCNRQYHFIIPSRHVLADPYQLPTKVEAKLLGQAVHDSKQLTVEAEGDDTPFNAPASVFDSKAHSLHGIIHLNGFGHLLRMNASDNTTSTDGPEGMGLSGRQLMDIWDSLCALLGAREVSVEDVSNKSGMLLRILHAAAYHLTWYGKWGYAFGRASFNIQASEYAQAVHEVHTAPLTAMLADFQQVDSAVVKIIGRYASLALSASPGQLSTLGELLQRMLLLVAKPELVKDRLQAPAALAGTSSRGSTDDRVLPADAADAKLDVALKLEAAPDGLHDRSQPMHLQQQQQQQRWQHKAGPAPGGRGRGAHSRKGGRSAGLSSRVQVQLPRVQQQQQVPSLDAQQGVESSNQAALQAGQEQLPAAAHAAAQHSPEELEALLVKQERLKPLQNLSVNKVVSPEKVQLVFQTILQVLQDIALNCWVPRAVVRDRALVASRDFALVDHLMASLGNVSVEGFAVYRSSLGRYSYYRIERLPETSAGPCPSVQVLLLKHADGRLQAASRGRHASKVASNSSSRCSTAGAAGAADAQHKALKLQPKRTSVASGNVPPPTVAPHTAPYTSHASFNAQPKVAQANGSVRAAKRKRLSGAALTRWLQAQQRHAAAAAANTFAAEEPSSAASVQSDPPGNSSADDGLHRAKRRKTTASAAARIPPTVAAAGAAGAAVGSTALPPPAGASTAASTARGLQQGAATDNNAQAADPQSDAVVSVNKQPLNNNKYGKDKFSRELKMLLEPVCPSSASKTKKRMQLSDTSSNASRCLDFESKRGSSRKVLLGQQPSDASAAAPSTVPYSSAASRSDGGNRTNSAAGPGPSSLAAAMPGSAHSGDRDGRPKRGRGRGGGRGGGQNRGAHQQQQQQQQQQQPPTSPSPPHSNAAGNGCQAAGTAATPAAAAAAAATTGAAAGSVGACPSPWLVHVAPVAAAPTPAAYQPIPGSNAGTGQLAPSTHAGTLGHTPLHVPQVAVHWPQGETCGWQAPAVVTPATAVALHAPPAGPASSEPPTAPPILPVAEEAPSDPEQSAPTPAVAAAYSTANPAMDPESSPCTPTLPPSAPSAKVDGPTAHTDAVLEHMHVKFEAPEAPGHTATNHPATGSHPHPDKAMSLPHPSCGQGSSSPLPVAVTGTPEQQQQQLQAQQLQVDHGANDASMEQEPGVSEPNEVPGPQLMDVCCMQPTSRDPEDTFANHMHMDAPPALAAPAAAGETAEAKSEAAEAEASAQAQTAEAEAEAPAAADVEMPTAAAGAPALAAAAAAQAHTQAESAHPGSPMQDAPGITSRPPLEPAVSKEHAMSVDEAPGMAAVPPAPSPDLAAPASEATLGPGLQPRPPLPPATATAPPATAPSATATAPPATASDLPGSTTTLHAQDTGAAAPRPPNPTDTSSCHTNGLSGAASHVPEPQCMKASARKSPAKARTKIRLTGLCGTPNGHMQRAPPGKAEIRRLQAMLPPSYQQRQPRSVHKAAAATIAATVAPAVPTMPAAAMQARSRLVRHCSSAFRRPGAAGEVAEMPAEALHAVRSIPAWSAANHCFDPKPIPPSNIYIKPGKALMMASLNYVHEQALCDLQHLYCHALREYKPSVIAAQLPPGACPKELQLKSLPRALQMLKDSRYFLKAYDRHLYAPGPTTPAALAVPAAAAEAAGGAGAAAAAGGAAAAPGPQLRLLCQVRLPDDMHVVQQPVMSLRGRVLAERRLDTTPPELVLVSRQATVRDLKQAISEALAEVYRMFKPRPPLPPFQVTDIISGLPPQVAALGESSVLTELEDRTLLTVMGTGIDKDSRWRHAGGTEDWQVFCDVCGTQDDDGERMIACDTCGIWMHTRCCQVKDEAEQEGAAAFVCEACQQKAHSSAAAQATDEMEH